MTIHPYSRKYNFFVCSLKMDTKRAPTFLVGGLCDDIEFLDFAVEIIYSRRLFPYKMCWDRCASVAKCAAPCPE